MSEPTTLVEVVESVQDRRQNSVIDDLVQPDGYSLGLGGNPFEPAVSRPDTFLMSADYNTFTLNRTGLNYGYKTYGLVRSFIRMPVEDAFRGGVEIEIPEIDDAEALKELHELMKEEGDLDVAKDVGTWARLFGGAGLIIVTEQNPGVPLNEKAIKPGTRLKFLAADRWELTMSGFNNAGEDFDKLAGLQYGYSYQGKFNYYGLPLDDSRVIKMMGQVAPSLVRQRLQGWGLSELEQCIREIQTYILFQNMIFELVSEAKVDVHKIEDFNGTLLSANGASLIKLRVGLANWLKSYKNALVMDKNDEFDQKQLAFGGLADILEEFRINLCAALRIPMNKLFGQSASGFASGEDSLENYNAMLEVEVRDKMHKVMRTIIRLRCLQLWGYEPKFSFKFKDLRVLNGLDEEAVKTSKQNRVLALYDRDFVDGEEGSLILKKEGLLTIDTLVSRGLREPVSPLEMQQQETDASVASQRGEQKKEKQERQNGLARLAGMFRRNSGVTVFN